MIRCVLFAAAGALTLAACGQASSSEHTKQPRPTKLETITTQVAVETLRLAATIEAAEQSQLTFQVSGQLVELTATEGADVETGAILARLDDRDFRNALASARADFNRAEQEFARAAKLVEQNAISRAAYDQRQAQRDIAAASLATAEKRLSDTVLTAPYAGSIASVDLQPFETVSAFQPAVTILSYGRSEALVQMPASIIIDVGRIEGLTTWLELDAAPDVKIPVALSEAETQADPATQSFEVRFAFDIPENLTVLPGMTGVVTGQFTRGGEAAASVISLPVSAVISKSGAPFVWVFDEASSSVTRRDVVVGEAMGERLVILSGLAAGDQVVVAGGHYLYDGAAIRPIFGDGA